MPELQENNLVEIELVKNVRIKMVSYSIFLANKYPRKQTINAFK